MLGSIRLRCTKDTHIQFQWKAFFTYTTLFVSNFIIFLFGLSHFIHRSVRFFLFLLLELAKRVPRKIYTLNDHRMKRINKRCVARTHEFVIKKEWNTLRTAWTEKKKHEELYIFFLCEFMKFRWKSETVFRACWTWIVCFYACSIFDWVQKENVRPTELTLEKWRRSKEYIEMKYKSENKEKGLNRN